MKFLPTLTTLFYFTTIKMKSLTTLTTLFYFTTIKMKSLTTLTTLFKFTTIDPRDRTTVTTPTLSIKYFFPTRNFSVSMKFVCATVISPSGSSVESYMLYYPLSLMIYCLIFSILHVTLKRH